MGRSRLRRMRFAMGIQSYFCCLTASRLPGNGIVERSSSSQWLHYAPAMKVLRIRKCLIVGTRSVRRASGLLETGFSVNCPALTSPAQGIYLKRGIAGTTGYQFRADVRKSASDSEKETLGMSRAVGEVFEVSLSLGQENSSAAQAKRTDGTGIPSVARAGQSVTPEVAASLRRLEDFRGNSG